MTRVNFTVTGSTLRELQEATDKKLRDLDDGIYYWDFHMNIHPVIGRGDGTVVLWEADVDAEAATAD